MKSVGVLLVLSLASLCYCNMTPSSIFLRIDHYNPFNRDFFNLRYFINEEFGVPGGPIFIYVGGGNEYYEDYLERGAVYEIARDTGGYLFGLEHRYFGQSKPTDDLSTENLAFLTIHQALGDIAEFIEFIRENYDSERQASVILWGRGYGGALAVWARQKFPHQVQGVWASSSTLDANIDNQAFLRNTFQTIVQVGGEDCGDILTEAFQFMEDSVLARNTTRIEERLDLCDPINLDADEEIAEFFHFVAGIIGYQFVRQGHYPDIDGKCEIMRSSSGDAFEAFASWFRDDHLEGIGCIPADFQYTVTRHRKIDWDTANARLGFRQRAWLQCTQYGQFFPSGNGEGHPFGSRFDFLHHERFCSEVFGEELFHGGFMEEAIAQTNVFFGGLNPDVSRVFLTHGELDPARTLGPQQNLNSEAPVVVMSLQSFSRDLGSPSDTDYAVLLETKARARELILEWIERDEPVTEPPPDTTGGPEPAKY